MLAFSERVVTLDVLRRREEENVYGKREVPHLLIPGTDELVELNGAATQRNQQKLNIGIYRSIVTTSMNDPESSSRILQV